MHDNTVIDLAIRIKNGYMAQKEKITAPHSKFREAVLKKLVKLGYVKNFSITGTIIKTIHMELVYDQGEPAMRGMKIHSTAGRRVYVAANHLKPVLGGMGVSLLSTPAGVMTNKEAKKKQIGGELLFEIW